MVGDALQPLVPEMPLFAPADDRLGRHGQSAEGLSGCQRRDHRRHIGDQAFRQIPRFGAGVGDEFLALAIIQRLRHLQRMRGGPAEPRPAQSLQGGQIVQPGRRLAFVLHLDRERSREALRTSGDGVRVLPFQDFLRRSMAHGKDPALGVRHGHHLEIDLRAEGADFQFAAADNAKRRRFHPPDADHRAFAAAQKDGRGAGEGKVVNLVRLLPRHRRRVQMRVFPVRPRFRECVPYRFGVLRREHDAHDLAPEIAVFEDFLADQLSLAVAVGGEPDPAGGTQGRANGLEFALLVAPRGGFGAEQSLRAEQDRGPAFPDGVHFLRFTQGDQMALGREDRSVPVAQRGPHIAGLTVLLGDDDVAGHGPVAVCVDRIRDVDRLRGLARWYHT